MDAIPGVFAVCGQLGMQDTRQWEVIGQLDQWGCGPSLHLDQWRAGCRPSAGRHWPPGRMGGQGRSWSSGQRCGQLTTGAHLPPLAEPTHTHTAYSLPTPRPKPVSVPPQYRNKIERSPFYTFEHNFKKKQVEPGVAAFLNLSAQKVTFFMFEQTRHQKLNRHSLFFLKNPSQADWAIQSHRLDGL